MNFIRAKLVVIYFFVFISTTFAQPYFQWDDSIQVKISGAFITNPWAGGLNFIQASNIDLNLDGIKDLVMFDRTGNKMRTFINKGTVDSVNYKYDPQYENKFPYLHDWALLTDYNCDGKEDIFSYSDIGTGCKVYKNTSSIATGLQFTLVDSLLTTIYNPPGGPRANLYISPVDIPALCDIDNDGDLDLVTFAHSSTYIEYHQNQSMELHGNCDSLLFQVKNKCWGYVSENPLSNTYYLNDTCVGNVSSPGITTENDDYKSMSHTGGTEVCIDLNGDGDKEFIVGDITYNNLSMLTNSGDSVSSSFSAIDINFPANNASTIPVNLTTFPAAYYVDVNNDGIKDLVVSPNAPNYSENFNSVVYYKNTGANNFPVFEYKQSNLFQDNMIDVGEGAYPVFFDYDNDGLKDLFVADYGYFGASAFKSKTALFKNTGTITNPKFDLITRDYDSLSTLGILNMVPAFGDMDGDGDADMVIGCYNGDLQYFENTAAAGAPANFVLASANLKNSNGRTIDVGDFAAPQIVDVDNDGKNDLVIGSQNGKLAYYHHTGSATAAIPVLDSVTHYFGNVKVNRPGYFYGYSYPFLFKQGAVSKLLVGAESGFIQLYDSIDGNLSGAFSRVDTAYLGIFQGTRTAPAGADINNDGLMDLMVGNYEGGVSFYKGTSSYTSINSNENFIRFNFDLFPNPASNNFTVKINNSENKMYLFELFNVMGQLIREEKTADNLLTIDAQSLKQGVYICKVSEINNLGNKMSGALTKRIIIQR
ncbi:MAG: FG-GAP-like repeat-containing protein [Bacteroidia bacterium]